MSARGILLAIVFVLAPHSLSLRSAEAQGGLSKQERRQLEGELKQALKLENWSGVAAVIEKLGAEDNDKTVSFIVKLCRSCTDSYEVHQAAFEVFTKMTAKDAVKAQHKLALREKSWSMRAALVEACGVRRQSSDLKLLVKALKDKHPAVQVTAIRGLCDARVDSAIEPLLKLMEGQEKQQSPPWFELRLSLSKLFGKDLKSSAELRSYWTVIKSRGGLAALSKDPKEKPKDLPKAAPALKRFKLFEAELLSSRLVFVLDCSGSMKTDDSQAAGRAPQRAPKNSRMERAKKELRRLIQSMPTHYRINIVAFASKVKVWKAKGLCKLTEASKKQAFQFIDSLKADGVTVTDEALKVAFRISGARSFYLLSDGKPTLGSGLDIPSETIYQTVREANRWLKIRVHTLGFPGVDHGFMRELARQNKGRYTAIKG